MEHPSPKDLLDRCAQGPDPAAWAELVDRYGAAAEAGVRRALRRAGEAAGDPDRVADLVQECYCRLLEDGGRRLRSFRGTGEWELRTWLGRTADRVTQDRLRAEVAEKRGRRRTVSGFGAPERARLPDPAASPERRLLSRERLALLVGRWHRLARDEAEARVLKLVFLAGLTSAEAARASGRALSPSAVDSVVHRFRRRLAAEGLPVPVRG